MIRHLSLSIIGLFVLGFLLVTSPESNQPQASAEVIPSPTPKTTNYPRPEKFQVPILMYHYIRNAEGESELGKNLSVSPENFDRQIKYLKDDNYQSIILSDLADPERKTLSKIYFQKQKPIVLTFDDGYEDAYIAALPVLKKHQFVGTFFLINNFIDKEGRLKNWQIEEMKAAGMEFGSHTLSHPDLTKISIDEAREQISASKGESTTFCYPAGKYNQDVINLVQEAGYKIAVTTKIGIARETSPVLELPRIRVENTTPQVLLDKISYAYEQGI